jgi:hypothetical protein
MHTAEEIKKLKDLLDSGAITQDDFTSAKRKLLGMPDVQTGALNSRELEKSKELLDAGAISVDEFNSIKSKLLGTPDDTVANDTKPTAEPVPEAVVPPDSGVINKPPKKIHKRWWFWVGIAVIAIAIVVVLVVVLNKEETITEQPKVPEQEQAKEQEQIPTPQNEYDVQTDVETTETFDIFANYFSCLTNTDEGIESEFGELDWNQDSVSSLYELDRDYLYASIKGTGLELGFEVFGESLVCSQMLCTVHDMFGIEEAIPLEEFREKVQDYIQLVDTPNSNGDIRGTVMDFSIVSDLKGYYWGQLIDMESFDFVYPDDYICVWSPITLIVDMYGLPEE